MGKLSRHYPSGEFEEFEALLLVMTHSKDDLNVVQPNYPRRSTEKECIAGEAVVEGSAHNRFAWECWLSSRSTPKPSKICTECEFTKTFPFCHRYG